MRAATWLRVGIVAALLSTVGCELSSDCDPDSGACEDVLDPYDGGGDTGVATDAGMDAAPETGLDSAGAAAIARFCQEQFSNAVKWRDLFDGEACGCERMSDESERIELFLSGSLAYGGDDPEGSCVTRRTDSARLGRTRVVPDSASACAAAFAVQFAVPAVAATCPVDIAAFEAQIAHGAQQVAQLSVCRAAFVGRVPRDGECALLSRSGSGDSLECAEGLRCLPVLGAVDADGGVTKASCQPPRAKGETCTRAVQCADGLICAGSAQRVCIPVDELRLNNGFCAASIECIDGLVCRETGSGGTCVPPEIDAVCGQ